MVLPAGDASAQGLDSLRVRFEVGGSADYTNERYYETFDDTTFRRSSVDSPERRHAGVLMARLDGARGGGTTSYQLANELSIGDRLTRSASSLLWRTDASPEDRWSADPRFEYRRDRSLGRNLEEWRASAGLRYRRSLIESFRTLDVGLRGEALRSRGAGAEYVLDRNTGAVAVAFDQLGVSGPEWRLGYRFSARAFPDSTVRDHFEHGWETRLRGDATAAWSWQIETSGERRVTVAIAPTSRDNFWQERADFELERRGDVWGFRARLEADAIQYDLQDSTLYFDYQTLRMTLGPRLGGSGAWSAWLAPRGEALFSSWNPGEAYVEAALGLELEALAPGAWWSMTPAAGWRRYDEDPAAESQGLGSPRRSYAFAELAAFGDHHVAGGVRLRAIANARLEKHDDEAQDAVSLYFSVDVRKIF